LDKARELLLFSDLHVSLKGVQASFHLNLVHMGIENFSITDQKVAHEHSLAKLLTTGWSMDES
jgi:hypothetical protein